MGWGVFDDVFCPKEETFTFLENVLTEVRALFPGEYIHIGGDECPKTRWKECAHCQALMKKEGLKDEHELQSYFIQRIEKFVNGKGRKIIGWDEILEGGLAPNAAVMSWRGTEGGTAAARQHHNVVMCPGSHCYFDHYQGDPAQEPLAIGGYTPLQKVYGYEPVPDSLTAEEAQYILGAQGNLWTEYISTPEQLEYMALPRMIALSEVLWSDTKDRDERDFIKRLITEFGRLDALHIRYSTSLYQVKLTPLATEKPSEVMVRASCDAPDTKIEWWWSQRPANVSIANDVRFTSDVTVGAWVIANEGAFHGDTSTLDLHFNLATARPITCDPPPNERYAEGGPFTLVDGVTAGPRRVNYQWLGWLAYRTPVTITVDLGEVKEFTHAGIGALAEESSWIHLPTLVGIETATDTLQFQRIAHVDAPVNVTGRTELGTDGKYRARYVRFIVRSRATIPEGLPGAGEAPWVFLDEITVR
jgi:hexosaminidase